MKFKNLIIIFFFVTIAGCGQYKPDISNKTELEIKKKYKNSGFALIYNEDIGIKYLDSRSLQIYHKSIKKNSFVKITNPVNGKSLIVKVKSNQVKFSNFYNSVISSRIVSSLELNMNEPYVEIILISKNSTFIAKKAKTFEEEKNVAEKAPIDGIKISDLSDVAKKDIKDLSNNKFNYSIKVADFYYKKTATLMLNRIKSKTLLNNIKIIELSKTNYRVLLGPFNDIKSLKDSFEKMNSLYFENIEILKNV
jgi:hypothetical protein